MTAPRPALQDDIGNRHTEDHFNRKPFATRLAKTIADRDSPESLVIGLYGAWGEGKTTVLDYMDEALSGKADVVLVRFNPWLFSSDEALTKALIEAIASGITVKLKSQSKETLEVRQALLAYGGEIISVVGTAAVNPAAVAGGKAIKWLGERIKPPEYTVQQRKDKVATELLRVNKKVVVLLDDIDRLTRQEIQQVFKLIKVAADFPTVTYVLAFDPEMVAAAVAVQYGSGKPEDGERFLEKIVQLPLQLPHVDRPSITEYTFNRLSEVVEGAEITLTDGQLQRFADVLRDDIMAAIRTPRQAKRYANAVAFALPILKGETHPVDVMLVEALRVLYPKTFDLVRRESGMFVDPSGSGIFGTSGDALKEKWKQFLMEHDQHAISIVRELFPKTDAYASQLTVRQAYDDPRRQGVHKARYFNRYFQYAIAGDDVADREIDEFLKKVMTEKQAAGQLLTKIGPDQRAVKFLEALRDAIFTVPTETQHATLLALAQAMPAFAQNEGNRRWFANPMDAVLRLMRDFIEQGTADDSQQLGEQLIDVLPQQNSLRLLSMLEPSRRSRSMSEDYSVNQVSVRATLNQRLSTRLVELGPDLRNNLGPSYFRGLRLLATTNHRDVAQANLLEQLKTDQDAVVDLLKWVSPVGDMGYVPWSFGDQGYEIIKGMIDVDQLLPYLDARFPEASADPRPKARPQDASFEEEEEEDTDPAETRDPVEAAQQIAGKIRAFYLEEQQAKTQVPGGDAPSA